jgi:glycosyltransferase involved in cell wall biosynthesis
MSRRRVLILCYFYPPLAGGGVHRVLSFTRYLPALGWDCTVVCAGEEDYWVTDTTLTAQIPAETEVLRVRGGSGLAALMKVSRAPRGRRSGRSFTPLRRWSDWWLIPDSYLGWSVRARRAASRRIARGGIDALLSSSPPDSVHLAARALQRRFAVPWVADFRDPWIGLAFRTPPTAWHRARHAALERGVLEDADAVVVASRAHRAVLGAASGARIDAARVHHIPNGFESAPLGSGAPATPAAGDAFTLAFTGTLSMMPDTEVFLEAVHEMLKRHPEARRTLRARLAGPFDTGYADRAVALGLTGIVEFQGERDHQAARALQRSADRLLLWQPRGTPTMVPGKLYEYLDSGRPILAVCEPGSEVAELAGSAGAERVRPGDRDALAAAIERAWLGWRAGERPVAARPPWLEEHRRDRLSARLAEVLDTVVGERRAAQS